MNPTGRGDRVDTRPFRGLQELRPVALPGEGGLVGCGSERTFAVSAGGALLGWGQNDQGQLGLGHQQHPQSLPQPVPLPAGALRVASLGTARSSLHTCVIAELG